MTSKRIASIFRSGSRTYFYSSVFFPPDVRRDVFALYAFVRVADDLVDRLPPDEPGFEALVARYRKAMTGAATGDEVVDGFVELATRRGFRPEWTESFLDAMRQDIRPHAYATIADVEQYMYGSAEVVGLFMARILGLPAKSYPSARRLGTAMQYVNFLRDVDEDHKLGRTYIPGEVLDRFGLERPSHDVAVAQPDRFEALMRDEIGRYRRWQAEAETGYPYLPLRYRIPIQTAADMYKWTATTIESDPLVVFQRKIRPSVPRLLAGVARSAAAGVSLSLAQAAPVRGLRRSAAAVAALLRSSAR